MTISNRNFIGFITAFIVIGGSFLLFPHKASALAQCGDLTNPVIKIQVNGFGTFQTDPSNTSLQSYSLSNVPYGTDLTWHIWTYAEPGTQNSTSWPYGQAQTYFGPNGNIGGGRDYNIINAPGPDPAAFVQNSHIHITIAGQNCDPSPNPNTGQQVNPSDFWAEMDLSLTLSTTGASSVNVVSRYSDGTAAPTCWTISGPQGFADCATSGSYSAVPGTYSISADPKTGYTLSVNQSPQTVANGGSITFVLTYTNINNPPPPPPGSPSCNPASQTITVGNAATLSASGGNGTFSWSAPGGTPSSKTGSSFNPVYSGTGSYTVSLTSNGITVNCFVQVNSSPPPLGSIQVNSNVWTSWTITGPVTISDSGTTNTYTNQPGGTYTISVPNINGYNPPTISPGSTQTLGGNSIVFNINYGATVAKPSCTDDVLLSFATALPSSLIAGQSYPIAVKVSNTGDTMFYDINTYAWPYTLFQDGSTTDAVEYNAGGSTYPQPSSQGTTLVAPGDSAILNMTFVAPASPGSYTLAWITAEINPTTSPFYSRLASQFYDPATNYGECTGGISPLPGTQGYTATFGNVLSTTVTVTNNGYLQVNCASPAGATWTIRQGGTTIVSNSTQQTPFELPPGNYIVTFSNVPGYGSPTAVGSPANVTTANTSYVSCSYPLVPITPPTINSVVNSTCGTLTINWTDNSTNEDGFSVWRSSTSGSGYVKVSGDIPTNNKAGTGGRYSYTDGPGGLLTNTRYYYVVKAFANTPVYQESQSAEVSGFNAVCAADLSNSVKNLIYYKRSVANGGTGSFVAYTRSTILKDGDILRFRITVVNSGTATATINYIDDSLSPNMINPTNLEVDKNANGVETAQTNYNQALGGNNNEVPGACSGLPTISSPGICGTLPDIRLMVSGNKAPGGNNWLVEYDVTLQSQTLDNMESLGNVAKINYTDPTGTFEKIVKFGPILYKRTAAGAPYFREVAP